MEEEVLQNHFSDDPLAFHRDIFAEGDPSTGSDQLAHDKLVGETTASRSLMTTES
jgi:hypothetical protein